jgi:hypothetical protein
MIQTLRLGPSENITAGASAAQSSACPNGFNYVRVIATNGDARVRLGANDAGAASTFISQGSAEYFQVDPGTRVSAIRASAADVSVNVTFCTR